MSLKGRGFVDRDEVPWGILRLFGARGDRLRRWFDEDGTVKDPGTHGKRVDGVDLVVFCGEPERLGADIEKGCRLGEVKPVFNTAKGRAVDRYPMMESERGIVNLATNDCEYPTSISSSCCCSGCRPCHHGLGSEVVESGSVDQMSLDTEGVVDGCVGGKKPLG